MFDLGIQELIVIFIVALLVFGPKRLPELSRALGKGMRELKVALRGVKESFDEAESQIEEGISAEIDKEAPEEEHGKEDAASQEKENGYTANGEEQKEKAD